MTSGICASVFLPLDRFSSFWLDGGQEVLIFLEGTPDRAATSELPVFAESLFSLCSPPTHFYDTLTHFFGIPSLISFLMLSRPSSEVPEFLLRTVGYGLVHFYCFTGSDNGF